MENKELLDQLEETYAYLKEDLNALEDLQENYFISTKPIEDFEYYYFKIQNTLRTIVKAMKLNELKLKKFINEEYSLMK